MNRLIKSCLGRLLFVLGIHRLFLRDRGLIVLFHRVDDRLKDNPISCGVSEFRDYCAFFQRYFEVISLSEMLRRTASSGKVGGTLAITFDDGYLDNSEIAAPILAEFRQPATFFIASSFIGSNHVPWWDKDLPFAPDWMSWDQVRKLDRQGFEIGAHTHTHVDLGDVDVETADREIKESKRQLEQQLGKPIGLFSYPYGRRNNIRPDTRQIVQDNGFDCCVSAFGGDVKQGDDKFHIKREPISPWFISPYQFGFEIAILGALRPRDGSSRGLPPVS